MSGMDPKTPEQLAALADKVRLGTATANERHEVDAQRNQTGPLGRKLGRIVEGRG